MSATSVVVGIDVAKAHVDVAVRGGELPTGRFANDEQGHTELAAALHALPVQLVVLEATGGYEASLACALQAAGLPVAVVNPKQARDFAKAMGHLAKTDRIDARVLAEFAAVLLGREDAARFIRPLIDHDQRRLAALVIRRRQLLTMLTAERQRLQLAMADVRPSLEIMIKAIKAQIDDMEAQMAAHVREHFGQLDGLLQSTNGIGPIASATLIAALPELGRLNRRAIAALVGVAPMANESGTSRGRRQIKGGRFEVRRALYMATVAATTHNPVMRAFYKRLRDAGKLPKVALVASMRKMLTILNAMVRNNQTWNPAAHRA